MVKGSCGKSDIDPNFQILDALERKQNTINEYLGSGRAAYEKGDRGEAMKYFERAKQTASTLAGKENSQAYRSIEEGMRKLGL